MSETFTDSAVKADQGERMVARGPVIRESIVEGESTAMTDDGGDSFSDDFSDDALPAHIVAKLDAIDAKRKPPAEAAPVDDAESTDDAEPVEAAPAAEAAATTATTTTLEEDLAERDRLRAANAALLAELEAARAKPATPPAPVGFVGKADYLDDSMTRVREFIAHELGVEPNAPEVDAELAYLNADLTAKDLGITTDAALSAKRDAARAKQLFAREKRQRTAGEATGASATTADAEAKRDSEAATFIGARFKRDDFPLLGALAQDLDGKSPEALVWQTIQRETRTGRLNPAQSDDALISSAAKLIEDRYQALIAKAQATKTPSTATSPSAKAPAPAPTESKATRQSHGARTITAADASVAPATPPATKPKTDDKKPKFKSDRERLNWALRHLDK